MKESALLRKVVGEKLLNQDSIQERAIATAKATLLRSDGKAASGLMDTEVHENRPRTRRLILAINLTLMAVVVGLVVIIAADLIHPTWMPVWLGGYTTTTNSTTISTTTATSGTTEPKPTFPSIQDSGLLEGIPWSEYSKTKIHQAEINLTLQEKDGFGIQLIDEEQNLYLDAPKDDSYGAAGLKYPDSTSELYIYNLTDGTYKRFAQASSHKVYLSFLAENEKYIVWREVTPSGAESINPVYHIYVRETGEDITFTLSTTKTDTFSSKEISLAPWSPILVLDDAIYLEVFAKPVQETPIPRDLYRYSIVTHTLEQIIPNAASPFLYKGELAWFSLDYTNDKATPTTARGTIAGLPVLSGFESAHSKVFNDLLIYPNPSDDNDSLTMTRDGVSTLVVSGRSFLHIQNPQTNGKLITFDISKTNNKLVYDVGRLMLVEMTDLPENARSLGFFENRMVFVDMTDTTADSNFHAVMYWIDLDEVK